MGFRLYAITLCLISIGCGESGIKTLTTSGGGVNAALSTADRNPVVMLELKPGMTVQLANVTYDQFGRIDSYDATVTDGSQTDTIKLHQSSAAQYGKPAEYAAELDTKSLPTINTETGAKKIGFSLKEQGGAVLSYSGAIQVSMKSELGYDGSGRAHVKRQTFTHEGRAYDIGFSGHAYDQNGRLTGYKANVQAAG